MPLVICKGCGRDVSDKATQCLSCGQTIDTSSTLPKKPKAERTPTTNPTGCLIGIVGVFLCFTGVGLIIGIPVIIIAMLQGAAYQCSNCKASVGKKSPTCMSCGAQLEKAKPNPVVLALILIFVAILFLGFIVSLFR